MTTHAEASAYLPRFLAKTSRAPAEPRPWWTGDGYQTRTVACLEWTGATNAKGFGRLQVGRTFWSAHKFAAFVFGAGEPLPPGCVVDRLCRNGRCVEPEHLEVITPDESVARTKRYHRDLNLTCRHGHLWAENEMHYNGGAVRYCGECNRTRVRAWHRERRQLLPPKPPKPKPETCRNGHLRAAHYYTSPTGSSGYCRLCNADAVRRYHAKHRKHPSQA